MKLRDIVVLLPCRSLEDLSLEQGPRQTDSILGAWSAPFHPGIVVSAQKTPRWVSAEYPPSEADLQDALVMLPTPSESMLPKEWVDRARSAGAIVLDGQADRPARIAQVLAQLDAEPGFLTPEEADPELAADLVALGLCYLQVELLTRQLRYMSSLDAGQFETEVVRAAEAILRAEGQTAREHLQRGFDLLTEGREYFYPVEARLLDLTLVASTTLGPSLRREIDSAGPCNLLISGEVVEQVAQTDPPLLARMAEAIAEGRLSIAGGTFRPRPATLLSPESILAEFRRGLDVCERHLGARPKVFASRELGLCPFLPGVLAGLGFRGAMHFALDGARFPGSNQSKIRWEGPDGSRVDSLARVPTDASQPQTYLRLPEQFGRRMDLDHVATAVFAHWPGRASPWHEDLRRMARYSPALGRFLSLDEYFSQTEGSGEATKHGADAYRSACLVEDAATGRPDPISRWVRYHGRRVAMDALSGLVVLRQMITARADRPAVAEAARLLDEVEDRAASSSESRPDELDAQVSRQVDSALRAVAAALPRGASPAESGCLAINPWSFSRRGVPAMGFAWAAPQSGPRCADKGKGTRLPWRRAAKSPPPMAEPGTLRNEFFEVTVDPVTGAIRAIRDYRRRRNRLGMQLALRSPQARAKKSDAPDEADQERDYSIMAADAIEVASPSPDVGQIDVRGRLVDRQGQHVARFAQSLRVRRGSRVLEIEIQLDPERLPEPRPWDSYYAARFAWHDESAELGRSVNLGRWPTEATVLEAPHFVEIHSEPFRTTILTAGLPFHRRFGSRKLDTLLVVHGETARQFRLGVGIDLAHPAAAALEFMAPPMFLQGAPRPATPAGWLFHLDVRHVVATHWEPIVEGDGIVGFRARLLETEGLHAPVGLRSFRPVAEARRIDLRGEPLDPLPVEGDRIVMEIRPYQWLAIEARWKSSS